MTTTPHPSCKYAVVACAALDTNPIGADRPGNTVAAVHAIATTNTPPLLLVSEVTRANATGGEHTYLPPTWVSASAVLRMAQTLDRAEDVARAIKEDSR